MDVEKAGSNAKRYEVASSIQRASAMLLVFSCLLLVEGVIRVVSVSNTPDGMWKGSSTMFPPVVLLIGAVFEVFFAMFGLVIAAASLLLESRSVAASTALVASILPLGWFTFIVYTYAQPGFDASKNIPKGSPLSVSQWRTAMAFGYILASTVYCFVLQGGQFYFALHLLNAQKEGGFAWLTAAKQKVRLMVYSGVVMFAGFCILLLGALLRNVVGKGPYMMPSVYPPNVVIYPEMTIVSGVLEFIYGAAGLVLATSGAISVVQFAGLGCVTWLYLIGAHILGQLGLIGGMVAGPAAQITVLTTSLILMPIFFASEMTRESAAEATY